MPKSNSANGFAAPPLRTVADDADGSGGGNARTVRTNALPTRDRRQEGDHATFRYRIDGPEVPHDISLTVPAGQVVGIVGPSGSRAITDGLK
jgi:ABC-type bacteriocin/lantibiotic exporter with double-glycine peptidase domain